MLQNPRTSWFAWAVLTLVAWVHLDAGLGDAPAPLATHFGAGGRADGWMSPSAYSAFLAAMWAVLTLSFWGPRYLLRAVPTRWVNLPAREYWLAPERREGALARMSAWLEAFGLLTLVGLVGLNELLLRANALPEPRLPDAFAVGFFCYLGFTALWVGAFVRAFRAPSP